MSKINIRQELPDDFKKVYNLIEQAFKTAKISDGDEQDFYQDLKTSNRFLPELALVAEINKNIIGQILLTHFTIKCDNGHDEPALLLAPLCVLKEFQCTGVGSMLVQEGLSRARNLGYKSVFLLGDPAYYSRFGFKAASHFQIRPAQNTPAQYLDYIQALELSQGGLKNSAGTIDFHS